MSGERVGALRYSVRCRSPGRRHGLEHLHKAGPAIARLLREISSAPERLRLRRQEDRQRPSALFAQGRERRHIDLIDIRPLLAIHLDIDEETVHDLRDFRVLEALMGHHMAPVAGGITDRKQDRLLELGGFRQRSRMPGAPVNGIRGMLPEVRTRLVGEQVARRLRTSPNHRALTVTCKIGGSHHYRVAASRRSSPCPADCCRRASRLCVLAGRV